MSAKIKIARNSSFPIPANHLISEISRAVEYVKPNSALTTIATMTPFFDHGGILAMAISEDEKNLAGIATLIRSYKLNKTTGRIEHVSVFPQFQGKGIGRMLIQRLLDEARVLQLKVVDLTSDPSREVANLLYARMGFERRETNVWRYKIENLVAAT